jgi:hypothetical protein
MHRFLIIIERVGWRDSGAHASDGRDAGRLILRIAASSSFARTHGTVHVPIQDFRLDQTRLAVGSLVVGVESEAAVRVVALPGTSAAVPFHPTTVRAFAGNVTLRLFARAFSTQRSVTGALFLKQNEEAVRTFPVRLTSVPDDPTGIACEVLVPLAGLASGSYTIDLALRAGPTSLPVHRMVAVGVR